MLNQRRRCIFQIDIIGSLCTHHHIRWHLNVNSSGIELISYELEILLRIDGCVLQNRCQEVLGLVSALIDLVVLNHLGNEVLDWWLFGVGAHEGAVVILVYI